MVFLIAAGFSVPVILSGLIFQNKGVMMFTAIVMIVIGAITGNPHFFIFDALGVAGGYFIGSQFIGGKKH